MTRFIFILFLAAFGAADIELTIDEISQRNVKVGRIVPQNPHAVIGRMFHAWCILDRRKLLRSVHITTDDVFFQLFPVAASTPYAIPDTYVVKVNESTLELRYPNVSIEHHRGDIRCLARINSTSVLFVDDQILYAGYSPGVGSITKVITNDLVNVKVTYTKSHHNPSYPTEFVLLCQFSESNNFSECPSQTALSNDTIEFMTILKPGEQFGDNQQPISVCVKSESLLGGTAIGSIVTFSLYNKFKPHSVSDISIEYSREQTATVSWRASDVVPLGLVYTVSVKSKWHTAAQVYQVKGMYFDLGPFSVTLDDLYWATMYNITIVVKPLINGYPSDPSDVVSFVTAENIPAVNPSVTLSGYERIVNEKSQDVVLYWQPVPEFLQNGVITKTIIQMHVNQDVRYLTVNQSEAMLHQASVRGLHTDASYLFDVMIGTDVGVCHEITKTISVISLSTALPSVENMTALAEIDNKGRQVVRLSWKPYHLEHARLLTHWCSGRESVACQGVLHTATVHHRQNHHVFDDLSEHYTQYKYGLSIESNTSTCGIRWVSCVYDNAKAPRRPTEWRSAEVEKQKAHIYIKPGQCTQEQGFMYRLTVILHNERKGTNMTRTFPVNHFGVYTIKGLSSATSYHLFVYADSIKMKSLQALEISLKTHSNQVWILIVLIAILLPAGLLLGYLSYKYCRPTKKDRQVPCFPEEQPLSQPRSPPDGGYSKPYNVHTVENSNSALKETPCDDSNTLSALLELFHLEPVVGQDSSDGRSEPAGQKDSTGSEFSAVDQADFVVDDNPNNLEPNLYDDEDDTGDGSDNSDDDQSNIDQYQKCHVDSYQTGRLFYKSPLQT